MAQNFGVDRRYLAPGTSGAQSSRISGLFLFPPLFTLSNSYRLSRSNSRPAGATQGLPGTSVLEFDRISAVVIFLLTFCCFLEPLRRVDAAFFSLLGRHRRTSRCFRQFCQFLLSCSRDGGVFVVQMTRSHAAWMPPAATILSCCAHVPALLYESFRVQGAAVALSRAGRDAASRRVLIRHRSQQCASPSPYV